MQLTIDPTLVVARTILAMLRHEFGQSGIKAERVAMNLAKFLDRNPEEIFGLTYNELFEAAIQYRMMREKRRPAR